MLAFKYQYIRKTILNPPRDYFFTVIKIPQFFHLIAFIYSAVVHIQHAIEICDDI